MPTLTIHLAKIISYGKNIILVPPVIFNSSQSKKKSSVIKFVNSLKLFGIGYSWGGFESLAILQEIKSSRKDQYLKGRKYYRFDKDEYIVRIHIGLEDPKDLIADLKNALKNIK